MSYRKALIALIVVLLLGGVVCAADCPGGKCQVPKAQPKIGIGGDIGVNFGRGYVSPHVNLRFHYPTPKYYYPPRIYYPPHPRYWHPSTPPWPRPYYQNPYRRW